LDLRSASILAYRLVDECIESNMFGLGGPVDIWQTSQNGSKRLIDDEITGIRDSVKTIKEHEVTVFERNLTLTSAH
jgi:hypothetical protein